MDSLGTFFREAREAQELTLGQVSASTRIQESYLKAIEEEHFQVLPQKVFTKGFVRTYAQTLGLDEEEALRRFSAVAGSYYLKEEEEHQQVIQREEDDRKGKANRNAVIILTARSSSWRSRDSVDQPTAPRSTRRSSSEPVATYRFRRST